MFTSILLIPEITVTLFSSKHPLVVRAKCSKHLWQYLRELGMQLALIEFTIANLVCLSAATSRAESAIQQQCFEVPSMPMTVTLYVFLCKASTAIQD
ncbi:hypothetical protein Q4I28_002930 [Leishmania naiffi]|uniref:Uncharacterized protein n=1 Tax=Leishmania naiffi TaxID=5678 RepID=A0AAW3BXQ2_9TRYP